MRRVGHAWLEGTTAVSAGVRGVCYVACMTYRTGMPSWHSHCTGPLSECRRTSVPQYIKFRLPILSLIAAALLVAAIPSPAQAQRAQPRSAVPHPVHVHSPAYRPLAPILSVLWQSAWWASYGYPWAFSFYGYPYGHGYGFGYGYPYPYGYYPVDITTAVRLQVTPREAEVFVDGYSAGVLTTSMACSSASVPAGRT